MNKLLTLGEFTISYKITGAGTANLIAFPGFGRPPEDYEAFSDSLGAKYRIIILNHYHHFDSVYPEDRIEKDPVSGKHFGQLLELLFQVENISTCSLIGYSMGGRVALFVLTLIPSVVDTIYLIAPDGLKQNFWRGLGTMTGLGRLVFKYVTEHPNLFFRICLTAKCLKIINAKLYKFAVGQMQSSQSRWQVYNTWVSYRKVNPTISQIARCTADYSINVELIFGEFDSVIPASIGNQVAKKIPNSKLHILPFGHGLMNESVSMYFKERVLLI